MNVMGKAERLLGPVPDTLPSDEEIRRLSYAVRQSGRANLPRLGAFFEQARRGHGIPESARNIIVKQAA